MLQREAIIRELWSRMSSVEGVKYTARNPGAPPNVARLPAIQIFEFPDKVMEVSKRGGYPIYKRKMQVIIEHFVAAATEGAATKEIMAFLLLSKKKLYAAGATLGGLCSLTEVEASRILRPATGSHVAGIGVTLEITYVEDVGSIMS